jgi:hypothetical protein
MVAFRYILILLRSVLRKKLTILLGVNFVKAPVYLRTYLIICDLFRDASNIIHNNVYTGKMTNEKSAGEEAKMGTEKHK